MTVDGKDAIAVRSYVYLALSYDHRIVDGADAARFLGAVKTRLEAASSRASSASDSTHGCSATSCTSRSSHRSSVAHDDDELRRPRCAVDRVDAQHGDPAEVVEQRRPCAGRGARSIDARRERRVDGSSSTTRRGTPARPPHAVRALEQPSAIDGQVGLPRRRRRRRRRIGDAARVGCGRWARRRCGRGRRAGAARAVAGPPPPVGHEQPAGEDDAGAARRERARASARRVAQARAACARARSSARETASARSASTCRDERVDPATARSRIASGRIRCAVDGGAIRRALRGPKAVVAQRLERSATANSASSARVELARRASRGVRQRSDAPRGCARRARRTRGERRRCAAVCVVRRSAPVRSRANTGAPASVSHHVRRVAPPRVDAARRCRGAGSPPTVTASPAASGGAAGAPAQEVAPAARCTTGSSDVVPVLATDDVERGEHVTRRRSASPSRPVRAERRGVDERPRRRAVPARTRALRATATRPSPATRRIDPVAAPQRSVGVGVVTSRASSRRPRACDAHATRPVEDHAASVAGEEPSAATPER